MKYEIRTSFLEEFAEVKGGKRLPKGANLQTTPNTHPYIRIRDLGSSKILELNTNYEYVDDETQKTISRYIVNQGDILISIVGTIGLIGIVGKTLEKANLTENCVKLVNVNGIDREYLYYYLTSKLGQDEIIKGTVGAVQPKLPIKSIQKIAIKYPLEIDIQKRIASILRSIDEKIALNNAINNNLLDQVMAYYRHMFVKENTEQSHICRADEVFDISIGKTPPRKEFQWFSDDPKNIRWVSISDMGDCGVFISDSSEYLTPDAVSKFNLVRIPSNTVLLSFKLTVGRIAITDGEMTTNEAIAHFKTDNKDIVEYLYCYLKTFNYGNLGSTSSIATAVNSKIIKAMPFVVPSNEKLKEFHDFASPFFSHMKAIQAENKQLTLLRDSLLPRLLDGELDLSEIEI